LCDKSILVTAPLEVRLQRVNESAISISYDEAAARDARQFPEEKKMQLADHLIKNDGSELVIPQVLALHQQFISLVKS
jgi:dephospho-CoA kinase